MKVADDLGSRSEEQCRLVHCSKRDQRLEYLKMYPTGRGRMWQRDWLIKYVTDISCRLPGHTQSHSCAQHI